MSTRREAKELARILALSTQEYAQISHPGSGSTAGIHQHKGYPSYHSDPVSGSGGSGSADRSRETDDSRELEIRPVLAPVDSSAMMPPPESIVPAWSSSSGNGKSKSNNDSTYQSPIQSFTPSSSARQPGIQAPPHPIVQVINKTLPAGPFIPPPRLLPSSLQYPNSTPISDPANRSSESDTPSAPLFSPTQVSVNAQKPPSSLRPSTGDAAIEMDDDDEIASIPGSPVPPGGKRTFSRLLMSPEAEDEPEEEEPVEEKATAPRDLPAAKTLDSTVVDDGVGRGTVEVVIPRAASSSRAVQSRQSSATPAGKTFSAPSAASPTEMTTASASTRKRRSSPDPLAPSPARPSRSTRDAHSTVASMAAPASAASATSGPASFAASNSSKRRTSVSSTAQTPARVSSRQAEAKKKEEEATAERRRKRAEEKALKVKQQEQEDEQLRKELEGGEVVRKQPSRSERAAASSSRRTIAPQASREGGASLRTPARARRRPGAAGVEDKAGESPRARRRSRSASRDVLEQSPVTELEATPVPEGDKEEERSFSQSPDLSSCAKKAAAEMPTVRQYSRQNQRQAEQGGSVAAIRESGETSRGAAEASDDDGIEIVTSPQRSISGRANKRQKTAHTNAIQTGSARKSDPKSKAKADGKRSKRVLSDTEDEEAEIGGEASEPGDSAGKAGKPASTARSTTSARAGKSTKAHTKKAKIVPSDDEDEVDGRPEDAGGSGEDKEVEDEAAAAAVEDDPELATVPKDKAKEVEASRNSASPTKRSPLQALAQGTNIDTIAAASPSAGPSKPLTTAPGGVKWRTQRSDLASLLTKFGGHKPLGMSRRTKIVSLHQTIGPPKKALPPAPKRAEKKKKGESDDEDEDDDEFYESDGEGGRRRKSKEKGLEWFMVED